MIKFFKKQLKQYFLNTQAIPNIEKSLEHLQKQGFSPKNIFDVGAYQGDFAKSCLHIWPESKVVCFEPIKEQYDLLETWSHMEPRVSAIYGLVGEEDRKEVKFNKSGTASSVLDEFHSKEFETEYHPMHTLKSIITNHGLPTPDLLKIDTQGYEYQVLAGLGEKLLDVQVILAELNFIDIHQNVKLAEDVIGYLFQNGFRIYDIAEIHRRPLDNAIWQTDFVFVKESSVLRSNKQWI